MSLTTAAVKAARPRSRAYKMADERGLFLFVAPTGLKSFRWKFRFGGKEQLLVLGRFPELSLGEARTRRDAARVQLDRDEDPRGAPQLDRKSATFEPIARAWHEKRRGKWSAEHAGDVLASLETHVFPVLGNRALGTIDAPELLELVQDIEATGAIETARRVLQRIGKIFAFAKARNLVMNNPAADLADELAETPPQKRQPALIELDPARGLIAAVDTSAAAPVLKLASAFLALTAVRWAAVRGARWEEIEDLDGPEPIWRVPAARMKLKKAKKGSAAFDHVVTLSPAAVSVLRLAHALTPNSTLIFPGRGGARPLGHGALRELYAALGYAGRHVPHGWRASFSTIMNDRFPEQRDAIDLALAHAPENKVEAAYNRSEQLARRRWLFDRWGALLVDGEADGTPS